MVICIFDNFLNENKHKKTGEVGEKASSGLVSQNEKLSVTFNILIHKKLTKSLLNLKNVLTRKGD